MKARFATFTLAVAVILGMFFVAPSMKPTLAQDASTSSQSTKSSTSTTTAAVPTQSHTTTTTVDPIWFIVGGVGLLALIGIIALASRGRSQTDTTVVKERETVIRE